METNPVETKLTELFVENLMGGDVNSIAFSTALRQIDKSLTISMMEMSKQDIPEEKIGQYCRIFGIISRSISQSQKIETVEAVEHEPLLKSNR